MLFLCLYYKPPTQLLFANDFIGNNLPLTKTSIDPPPRKSLKELLTFYHLEYRKGMYLIWVSNQPQIHIHEIGLG